MVDLAVHPITALDETEKSPILDLSGPSIHSLPDQEKMCPRVPPNNINNSAPMLPPCRVCGERASGFHYGANTCEACKGFFRRSLQRQDQYQCSAQRNCDILPGKRNSCAYCRFQKCLYIGMSKSAIKTGRYTHEKKARDIKEVKRLESLSHQRGALCSDVAEEINGQLSPAASLDSDSSLSPSISPTFEDQEIFYEQLIQLMVTNHRLHTTHTPAFLEKKPLAEAKCLEQRMLKEQMFGKMRVLTKEEYKNIYTATGIDVDGRREIIQRMIDSYEEGIKRLITFAKGLPRFIALSVEDQITLIKLSRFEVWVLAAWQAFNLEHSLFTTNELVAYHRDDWLKLNKPEYVDALYQCAAILHRVHLDESEIALCKGICMLFTDRCELKNPELIMDSQWQLIQALQYYIAKYKPHDKHRFGQIVHILTEIRTFTHLHFNEEDSLNLDLFSDLDIPPLVLEIVSK